MLFARHNALAQQICQKAVAEQFTGGDLLVVITLLQAHLLWQAGDPALRVVVGYIIATEDEDERSGYIADLLAMSRNDDQVH